MAGRTKKARAEEQVQAAWGRALLDALAALPPADQIELPEYAADRSFGQKLCAALCAALPADGPEQSELARQLHLMTGFFNSPEAFQGRAYPPKLQDDVPFW